jgi:hypothetical protein
MSAHSLKTVCMSTVSFNYLRVCSQFKLYAYLQSLYIDCISIPAFQFEQSASAYLQTV